MGKYIDAMKSVIGLSTTKPKVTESPQPMQSETIAKLAEQSFKQQWPDGLTLNDRFWKWDEATRHGVSKVLQDGIRAGRGVDKIAMEMQRTIESTADNQRFKIITEQMDDWVTELYKSALILIHDPTTKSQWDAAIEKSQEIINGLKEIDSRRAAEKALFDMKKAVEKGKEELLDKAVKWWAYDKQLYNLSSIARTEMSNAMHRAVIDGSIDDDTIIGYKWRLSASHTVMDICDYYASVDMGYGKGVFTKDAVPRHKAHQNCMCLLIPTVIGNSERGSKNYADWIRNLSTEKQHEVLPDWAAKAVKEGTLLEDLLRPDGFGLITQKDFDKR